MSPRCTTASWCQLVRCSSAWPALAFGRLDRLRDGLPTRKGFVPVRPELVAEVKFFGRYRACWIRDDVLLSVSLR